MTDKTKLIEEIGELIVIDYANLSGRESSNRSVFRQRVKIHLEEFYSQAYSAGVETEHKLVQELITSEINIAHSENQPTSRLTSLWNKLADATKTLLDRETNKE